MVSLYARLHKAMSTLTYFTTRSWEWSHTGLDTLKAVMTAEDSQVYDLQLSSINFREKQNKLNNVYILLLEFLLGSKIYSLANLF